MLYLNLSNNAIITDKCVDYHCIVPVFSKFESIHLLENSMLDDRGYNKTHIK